MTAMEKMVAQMLGITPEGMHAMIADFRTLITTLNDRLEAIETKLDALAPQEKEPTNAGHDGYDGDDNRERGDGGTVVGSGGLAVIDGRRTRLVK